MLLNKSSWRKSQKGDSRRETRSQRQRLAHCGHGAKSSSPSIFVKKLPLEQSLAHMLMYVLSAFVYGGRM